ncbi:MAG: glycosyltransferase family 4 protein [Planctomycetes bacterium]|nr:glycosyltransferase family 4 protein [Planctomycetota bacterium]
MADLAIDETALGVLHSSYARCTRFLREAAEEVGLKVESWRGGRPRSEVLWIPQLRIPDVAVPRLVVTCHDVNPLLPDGRPSWKRWWRARHYAALLRKASQRAWRVCSPSRDAAARVAAALGTPPPRVVPWFTPDELTPGATEHDAERLAAWGLEQGYVLYLGAFRRHKNWQTAARAYAGLPEDLRANHPLVLAGNRRRAEGEIDPLLEALGIRAHFVSDLADVDLPSLYRGARAFVFPSRLEGFGLPPLEAQACGVPVVASNTTSLPEVLGAGAALLDPDDVAGFTAALTALLADSTVHAAASASALANAGRFSRRATGTAMRALLEQ